MTEQLWFVAMFGIVAAAAWGIYDIRRLLQRIVGLLERDRGD